MTTSAITTSLVIRRRTLGGANAVQVILEDHGRGCGVEPSFALAPVALPQGEAALGFAARQPFVFDQYRQGDARLERGDEFGDRASLLGLRAVEPRRHADDDRRQAVLLSREAIDLLGDAVDC